MPSMIDTTGGIGQTLIRGKPIAAVHDADNKAYSYRKPWDDDPKQQIAFDQHGKDLPQRCAEYEDYQHGDYG